MARIDVTQTPANIAGNAQETLSVSSSAAQTAAVVHADTDDRVYDMWCDEADVYIKLAADAATGLTVALGYKIPRERVVPVRVPPNMKLGAITAATSGTLRYHRTA